MIATIDGRIVTEHWPDIGEGRQEYERTASTYAADAWMCGRITMEHFAGSTRGEAELVREAAARPAGGLARGDFVAPGAHPPYAVAVDPRGRLLWSGSEIDGDHVVAILGGGVSDAYLAGLRDCGVSYLIADVGGSEVGLATALEKLAAAFGIRTLLLEGGGRINGAMLHAGLVDEVSLRARHGLAFRCRAPAGRAGRSLPRPPPRTGRRRAPRRGRALDPVPSRGDGARQSGAGLTGSDSTVAVARLACTLARSANDPVLPAGYRGVVRRSTRMIETARTTLVHEAATAASTCEARASVSAAPHVNHAGFSGMRAGARAGHE